MALAALIIAILALALAALACLAIMGAGMQHREFEIHVASEHRKVGKAVASVAGLLGIVLGELDKQNEAKLNAIEDKHVSGGH